MGNYHRRRADVGSVVSTTDVVPSAELWKLSMRNYRHRRTDLGGVVSTTDIVPSTLTPTHEAP